MSYGAQSRLLLLCPGQGGQHAEMFDLARTSASAAALLDRLSAAMPQVFDGADIYVNSNAQPLIVAATLGMWEAIREFTPQPALVAGYSIGELSAYGVASAFPAATATELAAQRAQLMDACLAMHPGQALLALSGLSSRRLEEIATAHAFHISIETGDDACIAGGSVQTAQVLESAVIAAGGRCTLLPVEVASHTPFMRDGVRPFADALRQTAFGPMTAPVLAGISATAVDRKEQAVDLLSRQMAEKIRWLACMDACAEAGITYALELGPGSALTKMLQARHPHINTRSIADFRTLDGIRKWLDRAAE
jgi:[acyl-carrier-protein] S-malonyltransferase